MTEQYLPQGNSTQFGRQEPAIGGSAPTNAPHMHNPVAGQFAPVASGGGGGTASGNPLARGAASAAQQPPSEGAARIRANAVPESDYSWASAAQSFAGEGNTVGVAGAGAPPVAPAATPFGASGSGAVPPITRSSYFASQQRSAQTASPQSQAVADPAQNAAPVISRAPLGQSQAGTGNAGATRISATQPFAGQSVMSQSPAGQGIRAASPIAQSSGTVPVANPAIGAPTAGFNGSGAVPTHNAHPFSPVSSTGTGTAGTTASSPFGSSGPVSGATNPLGGSTTPGNPIRTGAASSLGGHHPGQPVTGTPIRQSAAPTNALGSTQLMEPVKPTAEKETRRGRGIVEADQNAGGRVGMSNSLRAGDIIIDELLKEVDEAGASDMHLTDRSMPMIRKSGSLKPLEGYGTMHAESLRRSIFMLLTQKQREVFEDKLELDFAYQVPGGSRFRVNLYQQRDSVGAAFRQIPSEIKALEDLGVPPVVSTFANLPRGLVLVTGPTGSGKSTTLASIVDLANRTRADHIMTVEDPIEFLHDHKKSIVNQREVGTDTWSFASALKHVLRQDPDIILVGEMRDLETISVALTAAETGHLVYATLHTQDAAQTIDRVIDVFPPEQQEQIRVQLASAIQGVVCQTLCKRADTPGRVVATEVMIATPAIRNLIREGKTHQIYSMMQAGSSDGMHTMDQHLADLTKSGQISYETGIDKCHSVADYNRLSGRRAGAAGMAIANAGMGGNLKDEGSY